MSDRSRRRIEIFCEDPRQEVFIRYVLVELGFSKRRMRFQIAPRGTGAAEQWVLAQYPEAVRRLRSRSYQHDLALLAMRDGDRPGFAARQAEMDARLQQSGLTPRAAVERIALPFPQWSIESWLLLLLGEPAAEVQEDKRAFEQRFGDATAVHVKAAARVWPTSGRRSASMRVADAELDRL